MLDLAVIIVSYNTRDLLRDCLHSVVTSASSDRLSRSFEIWVVDNASADGTVEMIKRDFPQVRLIANSLNFGFAAANNLALRYCTARYILLLNPDTVVLDDAITKMLDYLEDHPDVGVVGPKLLNADGSLQHSCFRFPNLWMSFFDFFPINHRLVNSRLNGRYPLASYNAPFAIDHPLGACMMVRREVLNEVGLLDEGFFIYCEEVDWCMRVRRAGWEIYCVPEARVIHFTAQSTRQVRGPMFVELHRSRYRLFSKHYGPFFLWAAKQIVRIGLIKEMLRVAVSTAAGRTGRDQFANELATYWQVFRM